MPNENETDLVELSQLQLQELAERGILFTKLNEFLADGVLTQEEQDVLHKLLHKSQQQKLSKWRLLFTNNKKPPLPRW